jgi:thiol-disulfide isomerase/thioredoxin
MYRIANGGTVSKAVKDYLFYEADYGCEGEITLGDSRYQVMLVDRLATGDFRGTPGSDSSGVMLMIDVNRNGRFESLSEMYDVRKPFNVKGTTYEIAGLTASGAEFSIRASDRWVPENLPPPPDLRPGHRALKFIASTIDGQEVNFPSAYAGKIVLLDFWATWCGPYIAELPHLISAYDILHDRGFDVLGISLDQLNSGDKVVAFARQKNMRWRQVYDGKFWKSEVAELYAVDSIPQAYLVDGDSGVILATGGSLRGEQLEQTLTTALRKKGLLKPNEADAQTNPPP